MFTNDIQCNILHYTITHVKTNKELKYKKEGYLCTVDMSVTNIAFVLLTSFLFPLVEHINVFTGEVSMSSLAAPFYFFHIIFLFHSIF